MSYDVLLSYNIFKLGILLKREYKIFKIFFVLALNTPLAPCPRTLLKKKKRKRGGVNIQLVIKKNGHSVHIVYLKINIQKNVDRISSENCALFCMYIKKSQEVVFM